MNVGFRFMDGTRDWGWICEQVPILRVEDTSGIVAVNSDTGELLGACVMDNWMPNSVQCHLAMTSIAPMRHGFIEKIVNYVFVECSKSYIYGLVPADKVKARKINKHMGFTIKTRLTDGFADGVDYLLMELKRENCPYVTDCKGATNG